MIEIYSMIFVSLVALPIIYHRPVSVLAVDTTKCTMLEPLETHDSNLLYLYSVAGKCQTQCIVSHIAAKECILAQGLSSLSLEGSIYESATPFVHMREG